MYSKIILRIIHFDFLDANYAWSSQQLNRCSMSELFVQKNKVGVIKRLALFFYKFLRAFISFVKKIFLVKNKPHSKKNILVYAGSLNQYKALTGISVRDDAFTMSDDVNIPTDFPFPLILSYIFSILLLPIFIVKLIYKNNYFYKSLKFNIDGYLISIGHYITWVYVLKKYKPQIIVTSNDHNPANRALLFAAKDLNVLSVFIQHAPTVKGFPILQFDENLLEGQHSKDIYKNPFGKSVKLIGSSVIKHVNMNNSLDISIGISTGVISTLTDILGLIEVIQSTLPSCNIILRIHPADTRKKLWLEISDKYNLIFSEPKDERPVQFLSNITTLIGPMSGLLLEAASLKKAVFCFNGTSKVPDWYDFLDNNVCVKLESPSDIVNKFNSVYLNRLQESCYAAASYYFENLQSHFNYEENLNKIIDEMVSNSV